MSHPVQMKIAVDAMGGDNAPVIEVEGAVAACREFGLAVTLVGDRVRLLLPSRARPSFWMVVTITLLA